MQPASLSSSVEDSTALLTLSSSLHTLSLASLRELLLSCALENEQVANHINACLHSQNGVKTPAYNLENFKLHTGSQDSVGGDSCPTSPALNSPQVAKQKFQSDDSVPNYGAPSYAAPSNETPSNGSNYNDNLNSSKGISQDSDNNKVNPYATSPIPSWNWSYYYYKESSTGAAVKRNDVDEAAQEVKSRAYYWNEEFQTISEKIRGVDLYDEEQVYVSMANLYQDFEHVVRTYGKIIISERFLPFAQKSIPPAFYMGGHAGGEKYIVQGILFKFSVDKNNLYNGDHNAAKSAGHDLKSLIQVYKNRPKGLHVPMMCLVDYLGYRLVAMSMLPVDLSTLCYGSCDAGNEVRDDIPDFSEKMVKLGKALNIKSHAVGAQGKEIVGPCDIEGHKGRDQRFYLLDFARLFPPEAPLLISKRKNAHLYRLLRPELVRHYEHPLSSDAFTLFGKRGAGVHNKEVREATEFLLNSCIPRFAGILDFQESITPAEGNPLQKKPKRYSFQITHERLPEVLHREGINIRHVGRVRAQVKSPKWRDAILREVIARVIKNTLREKMRSQMEQLKHPGLALYRDCIVEYLNLVFGTSAASLIYWNTEFSEKIEDTYEQALNHEKAEGITNLKEKVDLQALFACVRRLTGMIFSPPCLSGDPKFFNRASPFQESDLLSFSPKVKRMRIAAYAAGTALYLKAKYNTDPLESARLAAMSADRFESALRSNPDDDMILCSYALLLRFQNRFDEAIAYYKMAIHSNPRSARIMGHYAWFLYRDMHLYDKADKYYLKALEVDPKHSRTLADYATFLYRVRKDDVKAEEYYKKGLALGDKQAISGYATFLAQTGRAEEAKLISERLKSASGALILTYEAPSK